MTELAAPQISSLMEALPGIAAVLRSPVANAMVAISRSAADLEEFQLAHAEELLRFGVRRNLLTPEEVDKVLDELRDVVSKRPARPAPPVVKKAAAVAPKPDVPKVPHRPKGIQLKPAPKRPMPPRHRRRHPSRRPSRRRPRRPGRPHRSRRPLQRSPLLASRWSRRAPRSARRGNP